MRSESGRFYYVASDWVTILPVNISLGEFMQSSALPHRAAVSGKTLFARVCSWVLLTLFTGTGAMQQAHSQTQVQNPAQSATDFRVEVQVADQSDNERSSAYLLAFDQVLRRQVETRLIVEPFQREELVRDPSRYVQSFRYRRYDPTSDNVLLATRSVREGTAPTAVIAVAFPTDLAAIIQQQLIPVVEEQEVQESLPVIALVAVEQQGNQFLIGGDRGQKFQARAIQLAAANNLQLQFPEFSTEDLQLIAAEDIFNANTDRINNFVARYEGNDLLTGALYRLSPSTWQSDWSFNGRDLPPQTFGLTTATLDEALVSAVSQLSADGGAGGGFLSSGGSADSFGQTGVAIRVENIRSLSDYDNVLATLRELDSGIVTEILDIESMVFRATEQDVSSVLESLTSSRSFEVINADQFAGELSFRYLAR